jgi:pentatricopeptide repeat protein
MKVHFRRKITGGISLNTLEIGNKIYTLRKVKQITQEQLAKALGISAPAVSKWETGNAYPDITLLSPLARALGTTVDDLLSFETTLSEQDMQKIIDEISDCFEKSGYRAGYLKCRGYLEEYPNADYLKLKIGELTIRYLYTIEDDYSEEEHQSVIRYNIQLYEQVKNNNDKILSLSSIVCLVSSYMSIGEFDKAEELLNELPKEEINAKKLYPTLYLLQDKLDKASQLAKQSLSSDLGNIFSSLMTLRNVALQTNHYDIALQYSNTYLNIAKEFNLKANEASGYDLIINTYLQSNDTKNAVSYLNKYINAILSIDLDYNNNHYFSGINDKPITDSQVIAMKKSILRAILLNPYYKLIENTDEYKNGIERLKKELEFEVYQMN